MMIKKACLKTVLLICIGIYSAKAQYVSLNSGEIENLRKEMAHCQSCTAAVQPLLDIAANALSEKPMPIEKIRSEGLLMGTPMKMATLESVKDATKVYALAMAYKLSGEKKYLKHAVSFLKAWASVNKASGNPIDETKLEDLFMGYDLIRSDISLSDRQAIDQWLQTIADAERSSEYTDPKKGTSKNNWNSHRIKIMAMVAYTIHNEAYYPVIDDEFRAQIEKNLYPDGSGFDFHERDALHYHVYTLDPLLKAAMTIKRAGGRDFFTYQSPSGASLKKSVDFLVPFATGEKEHIEFANSKARFDRERAKNNEKGYQPAAFHREGAIPTLALAAFFDPDYTKVIDTFKDKRRSILQLMLNRIMRN